MWFFALYPSAYEANGVHSRLVCRQIKRTHCHHISVALYADRSFAKHGYLLPEPPSTHPTPTPLSFSPLLVFIR